MASVPNVVLRGVYMKLEGNVIQKKKIKFKCKSSQFKMCTPGHIDLNKIKGTCVAYFHF